MTREADITGNLEYIPLDEEIWTLRMLAEAQGYDRVNTDQMIKDAGYDIRDQIKALERIYSE